MIKKQVDPIWILLVALCLLWCFVLNYKYTHFAFLDWDFAFFNQSAWNLAHGRQYSSLLGYNFFGDHSSFLMLSIVPVYALFPSPLTLLYIKSIAFVLGLYWLYRLIREDMGRNTAIMGVLLYVAFPANIFSMLYEFSMECFAPVLIFMMFYAHKKRDLRLFWVTAVLLFVTKENLILIVVGFGVYSWLLRRRAAWSAWPVLIACVVLLACGATVQYFRGGEGISAWVRYKHLFVSPSAFWEYLFSSRNWDFAKELFGPFLIPALLSPIPLLIGLPIFLQHALSIHDTEHSILFFYGFALTPFIFVSAFRTLAWLRSKSNPAVSWGALLLLCVFTATSIRSNRETIGLYIKYLDDGAIAGRRALLSQIPREAKVVASMDLLAPLSSRRDLYAFYKIYSDRFQDPVMVNETEFAMGQRFVLPEDVEYALIDLDEPWRSNPATEEPRIQAFLRDRWILQDRRGSLRLYRRPAQP